MREKTRVCKTCKEEKDIKRFALTGQNKVGDRYRLRFCEDCRNITRRESYKRWKERSYTAKSFKCIYDPTGFYRRAHFTKGAVTDSLKDGNWPPGSWWVTETGSKYEVQGNELMHVIGGESKPQRLVRSYGKRQPPGSE